MANKMLSFITGARNVATVSPKVALSKSLLVASSEEGLRMSCLAETAIPMALSRISVVFNAGSRRETDQGDLGLTHLIRRSFGLSTFDNTAVNMTRHLQQMGARVTCTTTRESTIYSMDIAPNLIPRGGALLAELATKTAYYHWELKSTAYKLMQKDIELLNRRNLPALSMELLHEAAFGKSPLGCGLGSSVCAPADRIGAYSIEQIDRFLESYFTPSNCSLSLLNYDSSEEAMDVLREIKDYMHFRAPRPIADKAGKVHGFVGGDVRRDLAAATHTYASLAWPTHGRGCPLRPAYDLAACLITGFMSHVPYSGRGSKLFGGDALLNESIQAVAFTKAYSDHGLFGISLTGLDARVMSDRMMHVVNALRTIKFTEEDLTKAKHAFKAHLMMEFENPLTVGTDLAVQLSEPQSKYNSPVERAKAVDAVSLTQLNEAISKTVNSPRAALSVVGLNAYDVLPVSVLVAA